MKVIKEAKMINVYINIRYSETEENLIQRFEFNVSNKKYLHYLFDQRFLFKNKIEKMIKDMLLEGFVKRVDNIDCVEIYYSKQDKPKPIIKNLSCYIPGYCGCDFCTFAEEEGNFIFCKRKNKHLQKGVQRCQVFMCKDDVIT